MKLSATQRKVLSLMKDGEKAFFAETYITSSRKYWYLLSQRNTILDSTIRKLARLGCVRIVESLNRYHPKDYAVITEKGMEELGDSK